MVKARSSVALTLSYRSLSEVEWYPRGQLDLYLLLEEDEEEEEKERVKRQRTGSGFVCGAVGRTCR